MKKYYIQSNIFYTSKFFFDFEISKNENLKIIVIENFYKYPIEIRNFALVQNYTYDNCDFRTYRSFSNTQLQSLIQKYLLPFRYKIVDFKFSGVSQNGIFTYSTTKNNLPLSIHRGYNYKVCETEANNNFIYLTGIIFLSPNAPINSGIVFYEFDNSNHISSPEDFLFDTTKWKTIDTVGNVFNRLILFDSKFYHSIHSRFGIDIYDGRLTQHFCFKCIKIL